MYNLMLRLAMITAALTYFVTPSTVAQSLFDFSSKKSNTTQTNAATPKPVVLSPNDFRSAVSKKSQETKNTVTQEAADQFIKQPNQPPSSSAPLPPPVSSTPSSLPISSSAPVSNPPLTQPTPPPAPSTSNVAASPVLAPPPAPTPPPSGPTTLPTQNQPYTGFGTGNTNKNPPASGNSGWNIKY